MHPQADSRRASLAIPLDVVMGRSSCSAGCLGFLALLTCGLGGLGCSEPGAAGADERSDAAKAETPPDAAAHDAGPPQCLQLDASVAPASLGDLACISDFLALAAEPADFSLPGARSVKTVIDRDWGDRLYFQNTRDYAIHWEFASQWLSAEQGLSFVPSLAEFNQSEYYVPSRRFVLGAVTHYALTDTWVYEIAPYDTADAASIEAAFESVRAHFFAPDALVFHPTSEAIAERVQQLGLPLVDSATLLGGSDYVPFTLGESYGLLTLGSESVSSSPYRIVVSNGEAGELGPTAGFIALAPSAPLGAAALSAFARRVPHFFARDASTRLAEFDGQWVHLTATATGFDVQLASEEQGMTWWQARQSSGTNSAPPSLQSEVVDPSELLGSDDPVSSDVLAELVADYGARSAHFAVLAQSLHLAQPEAIGLPKALAVPAHHYVQFITSNGLLEQVQSWADDLDFEMDVAVRAEALTEFRAQVLDAPLDAALLDELSPQLSDWDEDEVWLVPSPNFVGAGQDPSLGTARHLLGDGDSLGEAVKSLWAEQWTLAAFDARAELGLEPVEFALGVLLEAGPGVASAQASGFALTNNPFDPSGLEPCYYANVQAGAGPSLSVEGNHLDQWLLYFGNPNQPQSSLQLASEQPLLSRADVVRLGNALSLGETAFAALYRPALGLDPWWAMQLWFGVDSGADAGGEARLVLRGASPIVRR